MNNALDKLMRDNPALAKALIEQVTAEKSLYAFTELMWQFVEPANPFVGNWHIEAICEHLEAVTNGDIQRLLINVPPGCMKSLLTDVFWPAWEWIRLPHMRYVCTSYSATLTERDNIRFGLVVKSDLYRSLWGDSFDVTRDSMVKVENNKTGWKIATSVEGMGTGERGNRVICDDLHNVKEGESETVRKETVRYFREVLPSRMTDPKSSAIIVIMQRVHENDVSGTILEDDLGYTHLMLPMKFEPDRKCIVFLPSQEEGEAPFFEDPREEEGELLFPERFPDWVVARDEKAMGPYATAGQMQQSPTPRGGGIIKRDWWQLWPEGGEEFNTDGSPVVKLEYPDMEIVIASVDTAYTEKKENDYCALAILGVFRQQGKRLIYQSGPRDEFKPVYNELSPKIMLMHAWKKRLAFRGDVLDRFPGEMEEDYKIRRKKSWGLLEWVAFDCLRFNVDFLLIENRTAGQTLSQEIRKIYNAEKWATQLVEPHGDKVTRAYSVQHIWAERMVYTPQRAWSESAISEMEFFPKGAHDDLTDAIVQGVRWLRDSGWALRRDEINEQESDRVKHRPKLGPLYDV